MKTLDQLLEGVLRSRRTKISAAKKFVKKINLEREQERSSGIIPKVGRFLNLYRQQQDRTEKANQIEKLSQELPEIEAARNAAIAKVDRRVARGFQGQDFSSAGNRLKGVVGLHDTIRKHEIALSTETSPQRIQTLQGKIAKARLNIQRMS